jgi:hypothetical protein
MTKFNALMLTAEKVREKALEERAKGQRSLYTVDLANRIRQDALSLPIFIGEQHARQQ